MKLASRFCGYDKKDYQFIILENIDDLKLYAGLNTQLKSKQAVDFWCGFKSQNFRKTPTDYNAHEGINNSIACFLCVKMDISRSSTSLVQYCQDTDDIINQAHQNMLAHLNKGLYVRINQKSGFCSIEPGTLETEYKTTYELNEQEFYNFLVYGAVDMEFKIKSSTIVLENHSTIPEYLIDKFHKATQIDPNTIQILTLFKNKCLLFKKEDYIRFFKEGIEYGLQNIVADTTAQDIVQINRLKSVLEYIIQSYPDKTLNIYIRIPEYKKGTITTECKNINIIYL